MFLKIFKILASNNLNYNIFKQSSFTNRMYKHAFLLAATLTG